jgi:hypothetical protein
MTESVNDGLVPHLELAAQLERCVDQLIPWLDSQPTDHAHEACLDLMVGLSIGAEAMRAWARGDSAACAEYVSSAVRHLETVQPAVIDLPELPL